MSRSPTRVEIDAGRDKRAELARLFDEHFDAVFGFCLARCGSRPLAEEIASDTFADAVRVVTLDQELDVGRGWLITVARRRMIDHWRRASRHTKRIERLMQERPRIHEPASAAEVVDDERVLAALASLPDRQRMALTLRYLDELAVSEVADVIAASYEATESLLARARRAFTAAYEGSEN